jgi:uncharacterized protein (DUF924 family)
MPQEILDFWFSDEVRKLWFKSTPEFDALLRERFEALCARAQQGELDGWLQSAAGCLALVIVLDQFPLNMFRGQAQSFASEAQSREVARLAIDKGFDRDLDPRSRAFLYMPFMHSEVFADQQLALQLFAQPGLEDNLRFARHHHDIVEKFGRFPHRNAALGRESSESEIEYLNSKEAFSG